MRGHESRFSKHVIVLLFSKNHTDNVMKFKIQVSLVSPSVGGI